MFGTNITDAGAMAIAIATFKKNAALRQPVRTLTKEVAKHSGAGPMDGAGHLLRDDRSGRLTLRLEPRGYDLEGRPLR
ncbi:hypothetical protein [Pseudomonas sp. RL]|uniref:hypothetical protein n=1 Tax=Pseudomonas sp. RL TaxID=1452718 RepID=UPI0012DE8172|nr:hypothetical protein [Pseudomonas sp. RL]